MPVENIMYVALGALAATLLALVIMPAVWRRAVRLTRRRIEAATPMTLAEFRADKDQLRSEFALAIRRLEQQNAHLRGRLAEELGELDRHRTELVTLRAEHETQAGIIRDLEERLVERDGQIAELTQQAQDYMSGTASPEEREALHERIAVLESELAAFTEAQPERIDKEPADLSVPEVQDDSIDSDAANADITMAEDRLNSIFEADTTMADANESLAERLNREDSIKQLQLDVAGFEASVSRDREATEENAAQLRKQLLAIAQNVGSLLRAPNVDLEADDPEAESLFARVQRFADEDFEFALDGDESDRQRERQAAAREIQGR